MTIQLHTLQPAQGSKRTSRRIGRGNSSGRGTYSGKGLKGQRARSGGRRGLKLLGFRELMTQIPQKRGFTSLAERVVIVKLGDLEQSFEANAIVTPRALRAKGLIGGSSRAGIKVLGGGALTKRLTLRGVSCSAAVRAVIEQLGGSVE